MLLFMGASISRYPLEGYREKCETSVTIGGLHAENPIELDIPITIAGMSFGSLSGPAKEALGRGASEAGTSTTPAPGTLRVTGRARRSLEVDRAILLHQNIISKPGLKPDQRTEAMLELGEDYMRAGLFDRAEKLFGELAELCSKTCFLF